MALTNTGLQKFYIGKKIATDMSYKPFGQESVIHNLSGEKGASTETSAL